MKVSTWNMQGNAYNKTCSTFAAAKNRMLNENIDVFCLQECGNLFDIDYLRWQSTVELFGQKVYKADMQIGTKIRGESVNVYFLQFGNTNFRCSMAIMVRAGLDKQAPAIIIPNAEYRVRPILGVLVAGDIAVYNIHAPSGVPEFARKIAYMTLNEIMVLKNKHGIIHSMLMGDFNSEPNTLDTSNELMHIPEHTRSAFRGGIQAPFRVN